MFSVPTVGAGCGLGGPLLVQAAQRLPKPYGGCQRFAGAARTVEMQEEGPQGTRFARRIAVHAAVNPEQVKVPDFHVDSLQIVGVIEPAPTLASPPRVRFPSVAAPDTEMAGSRVRLVSWLTSDWGQPHCVAVKP